MYTANVLTIKTMDFDHIPNPHKCLWAFHHSFNESWLIETMVSDAGTGGGALAPQFFGRSVNPVPTGEG